MPLDKTPPWDARSDHAAAAPQAPRAMNPETGEEIPDLTIRQRIALSTIGGAGRAFIVRWLPRQLLKVIAVASAAIGASEQETNAVVAWLVCAASFLLELLLSRMSRRFLKLQSS